MSRETSPETRHEARRLPAIDTSLATPSDKREYDVLRTGELQTPVLASPSLKIHELSPYQYNVPQYIQNVTNLPSPATTVDIPRLVYEKPRRKNVSERIFSEYNASQVLEHHAPGRNFSTPYELQLEEPALVKPRQSVTEDNKERILKAYSKRDSRLTHWRCIREIGKGSYSVVSLAQEVGGEKLAAVKVSKPSETEQAVRSRVESGLIREFELLQEIDHLCIVELIASRVQAEEVIMVMEFYRGGDLFSFASAYRPSMSVEHVSAIFANVASAVRFLHANNVVHRDIKLENVLLRYPADELLSMDLRTPLAVLSDFGLSKKIDPANPLLTTRCGSEYYVSPELLMGLPYDGRQNDVWALGVLLYALIEGRSPFDPLPRAQHSSKRAAPKLAHRIALIAWDWFYFTDDKLVSESPTERAQWQTLKDIVARSLCRREKRQTIEEIYSSVPASYRF